MVFAYFLWLAKVGTLRFFSLLSILMEINRFYRFPNEIEPQKKRNHENIPIEMARFDEGMGAHRANVTRLRWTEEKLWTF